MEILTTTNGFEFVKCNFYETLADPRNLFARDYDKIEPWAEEISFDYDKYCDDFLPSIKGWAKEVCEALGKYGLRGIEVKDIGHPKEYNFYTDWIDIDVEVDDDWRKIAIKHIDELQKDISCNLYFENNYKTVSGYIFLGPETWNDFKREIRSGENDDCVLINMYLTLCFVKEFGNIAEDKWYEISHIMEESLSYYDYAETTPSIPEGSEYLFKDCYTAEADEIYHKVLDKYGYAWRYMRNDPGTELLKMLRWANKNGFTIEELKLI